MSQLSQVKTQPVRRAPRLVIHGRGGVGKTTFGVGLKSPIFLPFEDGFGDLSAPFFPRPSEYSDVIASLVELIEEPHEYRSLVLDTIDSFEPLVWAEVMRQRPMNGKTQIKSIEDYGYGKGYAFADPLWIQIFQALDALRSARDMTICVLSHNEVKTIDDPNLGPYDRVQPKLHKRANALMYEWADIVGYLDIERVALEREGSKGRTVQTAQVTGRRVLHLQDMGGFEAKNRYRLPAEVEVPEDSPCSALRAELAKRLNGAQKEAA